MTLKEAAQQALEALEESVSTCFDRYAHEQVMSRPEHFVNQAITALRQALANEPGYTTTRNAWTGTATHKCNRCGKDDFRSEHAAKFHECEAQADAVTLTQTNVGIGERAMQAYEAAKQRGWVGLTDEEIFETHKQVDSMQYLTFGKAIEAKLKEKNS